MFFSILYCILIITHYSTYFAYSTYCAHFFILIFCISVAYLTYFIAYFSAYFIAYLLTYSAYYAYSAYSAYLCMMTHVFALCQVFVVYFLNFQKPKMTGKQKLLIIHLPRDRRHSPFIFHVPPQHSNPSLQHSQPVFLPTLLQIP